MALEKFVVRYKINRTNVPMMRSVLMAKLTREFTCFAEEDPGRKVALLFSNIEREMNTLCAEGDLKREDAVELHFKKLWQLNKSHVSREKTEAEGRKTRFDIWSVLVVAVMSLLFENIRTCLREHGFVFVAGSTVLIMLTNQNIQVKMRQFVARTKVRLQQRESINQGVATTLKDLFELELEGFLRHIKYDGSILRADLTSVLWEKFDKEVRIFVDKEIRAPGENVTYIETCSKDLQLETMNWFFAQLWDEIQDLSVSEGRGWMSAVALYFEKLCRRHSSENALFRPRRKYLGAEKWKESVGLTERQVEPQTETVDDRGITLNDGGTILFGTARNVSSDGVSEGNQSEQDSAVVKRAGWVDQHTCQLYLREEAFQLEAEASAEIIADGEDSGSGDNGMVAIFTSGNSCNKEDDDATGMTTMGSMEGGSSISSGGNSRGVSMDWTMVVNGTRYVGNSRPMRNSSFLRIADAKEDSSELIGETTKERNRRLLIQERTFQAGRKKVKKRKRSVRHAKQVQTLFTVKEDSSVEKRSIAIDVTEEEESVTCDCSREAEIILRRKVRLFSNTKRVRRSQRKKIKVREPSVRGMMLGHWRLATREFSYIIRLYSCSAVRYAMFRSNRRFKPGD